MFNAKTLFQYNKLLSHERNHVNYKSIFFYYLNLFEITFEKLLGNHCCIRQGSRNVISMLIFCTKVVIMIIQWFILDVCNLLIYYYMYLLASLLLVLRRKMLMKKSENVLYVLR